MGERWEQDILLKRTETLEQFSDDYYNLNKQIELDVKSRITTLEEEIEEVEKATQKQLEAIDLQIKGWDKYKSKWGDTVTQYQKDQDRIMAAQFLGLNWEADILAQREDNVEAFADEYYRLNAKIEEDVKKRIESLEAEKKSLEENVTAQIEDLNNLKDVWSKSLDIDDNIETYKGSLKDLIGAETDSYKERLKGCTSFVTDYNREMSKIKSAPSYSNYISGGSNSNTKPNDNSNSSDNTAKQTDIDKMKENSAAWVKSTSDTERESLAKENLKIGTDLGWTRDDDGVWYDEKGIKAYAKGRKSGKNELAIVDEEDKELIIRKPHDGRMTHLEAGDAVVPAPLTKKIFELAENPTKVLGNAIADGTLEWVTRDNPKFKSYFEEQDVFERVLKSNYYDPCAVVREEYEKKNNALINSTINNITHNNNQQQIVNTINMGGINLHGVQSSDALAQDIGSRLGNMLIQKLHERK